jgi:lipopolysaccharide/colanic/teichoic acid biosynthesis glycosyltransferase
LRHTSLDELPQLFSVLAGQMSLVGQRPVILAEMKEYGHRDECYLSLRPGITGLWQGSGCGDTTYCERVALDERYFHEQSLLLDVRALHVVLMARGAY